MLPLGFQNSTPGLFACTRKGLHCLPQANGNYFFWRVRVGPLSLGAQVLLLPPQVPPTPTRAIPMEGAGGRKKWFVTPTETNAHRAALCFMVMRPSYFKGWWLASQVWRVFRTANVGATTQGQEVPDHHVSPTGGAQSTKRHPLVSLGEAPVTQYTHGGGGGCTCSLDGCFIAKGSWAVAVSPLQAREPSWCALR